MPTRIRKMAETVMKVQTQTSSSGGHLKVMLNANDLLTLILCDNQDPTKEVKEYRLGMAEMIAGIIKDATTA
jgi:hypothetical protein